MSITPFSLQVNLKSPCNCIWWLDLHLHFEFTVLWFVYCFSKNLQVNPSQNWLRNSCICLWFSFLTYVHIFFLPQGLTMNRKREKVKLTWLNKAVDSPRKLMKNSVGVAQPTCWDGDGQDGGMSEAGSPGLNTSTGSAGLGDMENMYLSTPQHSNSSRSTPKTRLKLTGPHRSLRKKNSPVQVSNNKDFFGFPSLIFYSGMKYIFWQIFERISIDLWFYV